jgi:hypothetical protein
LFTLLSFAKSQCGDLEVVHLLLKDFVIRRKLIIVCIFFLSIWYALVNNAVKCYDNLMNQFQHIDKVIDKQTLEEKLNNRLRLKTSIDSIRYLASQGCTFRGHDEGPDSKNRGNFFELIKLVSNYNEDVTKVVLENTS